MKASLRVLKYMKDFWFLEVTAYLCMLGINFVQIYRPQLTKQIIDIGITENQPDVLTSSVLMLLVLTLVQGALRFGETYLTERVSQGIAYKLRNQLYQKMQKLSFSYHDKTQTGQLLSRTTRDVDRLRRLTGRSILGLVQAVILVISTAVILFRMNVTLAAFSLLVMPIIVVYMSKYVNVVHPMWHHRQDIMGDLTTRLEQNLYGLKVVRGFAQEDAEKERFSQPNQQIFDISMDLARKEAVAMPLTVLLASSSAVFILWLGGSFVIQGKLTLGEMIAFNSYVLQLVAPMRRLANVAAMLGESEASAERVFEVLDADVEIHDDPDAKELGKIQGRVEFEHVDFSYVGGTSVLTDISFVVEPGQTVALLGPTGSGKSTIINLIPRFYDVTGGAILVDGQDIAKVKVESLRQQIGIVLQETTLFGNTVRENIAFGRPDATPEDIENASKAAAAHDFIMQMPNGYETIVGERGLTLSGGQRQRIAIARALLLDPRILILDDATSSVDTETEQLIQGALDNLMKGRTSFVIAQRVSTVRNADLILVIDRGHLVARGQHNELIQESGIYASIYHQQLRSSEVDVDSGRSIG